MNDWLVELVDHILLSFMDDRSVDLSHSFLRDHWLDVLVDYFLMVLMDQVLMLFFYNFLIMLMYYIFVLLFDYRFLHMLHNLKGFSMFLDICLQLFLLENGLLKMFTNLWLLNLSTFNFLHF